MVDMDSNKPIYIQISDSLKQQIENGEFQVGSIIPSENSLVEKYKVTRTTIRHALNILVNEGYLYKKKGKGTYVADFSVKHAAYKLRGFTEEILQLNKKPNNNVIRFEVALSDEYISEKLEIDENEQIYIIERIRCIDEEPVIFERSYMPVKMFPDLSISNFKGSKYKYVEESTKERIKESLQEIVPEIVEEPVNTFLQMEENTPILKVKSTTTLESGTIFEYTELYFKTSRYKFIQKASRF